MPTASVGAPPARDRMRGLADVLGGLRDHVRRDGEAPVGDGLGRLRGRRADDRGRRVHREVDARVEHAGGRERHHRDERFGQHAAEADQRAYAIRCSTIFGVVPEEMSEWKPDTAPQAMVMNRNGNRLPENTGRCRR